MPRGQEGYDPLYKLGSPYHTIIELFGKTYYPTKNIAIDEGLVPWHGNIHFRVYNLDKPDKFGLKSYQLCDETGYCCVYELYTCKRPATKSGHRATYDVCMRLMNRYLNRGHHLYTDNYYTSPTLFSHLYSRGTGACGTLRQTGSMSHLVDAKPPKGETVLMSNGPLVIMKHTEQSIMKPDAIIAYNKYMGFVDHSDQLLQYLAMRHKTLKWYKK